MYTGSINLVYGYAEQVFSKVPFTTTSRLVGGYVTKRQHLHIVVAWNLPSHETAESSLLKGAVKLVMNIFLTENEGPLQRK